MRRPIDVLFVEPKRKRLVILHQDKFWQLPSMGVSKSSWILKLLYKGSLNDIVVSKNQHIDCPFVSQILKSKPLPAQLHGVSATRFLGWWETNGHLWLSNEVQTAPNKINKTQERPKTVINPVAPKIIQSTQTQKESNKPSTPRHPPTKNPEVPSQATKAVVPNPHAQPSNTQPNDVFDALLLELTHDVLHQSH